MKKVMLVLSILLVITFSHGQNFEHCMEPQYAGQDDYQLVYVECEHPCTETVTYSQWTWVPVGPLISIPVLVEWTEEVEVNCIP